MRDHGKTTRCTGWMPLGLIGVTTVLLVAGCAGPLGTPTPPPAEQDSSATGITVSYSLASSELGDLYPNKQNSEMWPPPYDSSEHYADVDTSIKWFTEQSLSRDGIPYSSVAVDSGTVTISGTTADAQGYAIVHPAFVDTKHAVQGLNGINKCRATAGCWDPHPGDDPWAFFLPLGLPLVQQQAVLFLNYPPSDSLEYADYLDNFTMKRWSEVLESVGITTPYLYETIVDAHPIAAPGSGQSGYMPDTTEYFNSDGNDYIKPMLALLTDPPASSGASTLPVMVLGTPAKKEWGTIIGKEVETLDVGADTLPGADKPTAWVAANHPDVTTYQCCPNDPDTEHCCSESYGCSYDLVPDEIIDLTAACIIQELAQSPQTTPPDAKTQCQNEWSINPSEANKQTICVRAKLDYDFTTEGQCKCQEAAEAFCKAYNNNPCPDGVFTCTYSSLCPTSSG